MRIKLNFTSNTEKVPNNLSVVNSFIHTKCFGDNNDYHDSASNYNVSRLEGGNIIENGRYINYPNGGYLIISSPDQDILNKILVGVMTHKTIGYGMNFKSVDYIQEHFYNGWNYFKTLTSGFLLKKTDENKKNVGFHTLNDDDIADVLKRHIMNKFKKINPKLDFSDFELFIDNHRSHKVKNIYSKNVKNCVNICQIRIKTNRKVAETIYEYGIGQSTGSGFGVIHTTQFNHLYE
ncbi:MAG: CRISPR-associated endoribonuclease Cas6 [bacterium]